MNTLDIVQREGTLVISSQTIATGAGIEHRAVLQLISAHMSDFEDFGQVAFQMRPGYNNAQVRVALLNEQQATLLMTYQRNSDRVRAFKKALVKAFFEMAKQLAASAVPKDLPEALRAYAAEVEQRQVLEARVAEDAPKVLFADTVAASDAPMLVAEVAKILKGHGVEVGGTRFFEWLRRDGYLIRRRGTDWNMPTQKAMELGLFKVKETAITHSDGHVSISKTTKVTGKGQLYFINRYAEAS